MTKKDMRKVVSGWGSDPTRRIILGLNIALDGAIAEAECNFPFDFRNDISNLLQAVWCSIKDTEISRQLVKKYEKELAPAFDLGAKFFFLLDAEGSPNCLCIEKDGFNHNDYMLNPGAVQEELRDAIGSAAVSWSRDYMQFEKDRKK